MPSPPSVMKPCCDACSSAWATFSKLFSKALRHLCSARISTLKLANTQLSRIQISLSNHQAAFLGRGFLRRAASARTGNGACAVIFLSVFFLFGFHGAFLFPSFDLLFLLALAIKCKISRLGLSVLNSQHWN